MEEIQGEDYNPNMSEADLAHALLKAKGKPMHFKDLFEKVMAIKPLPGKDRDHIMAGIHTELNLDGRFVHIGKGIWGIRSWMPDRALHMDLPDDDLDN